MLEANRPADQRRRRAALPVTEDLVALAELLPRQLEDLWRGHAGIAPENMSRPMRHQAEVPGLQPAGLRALGLQLGPTRGDNVEPHVVAHRGKRHPPALGQLGAAVEGAVHPQEVKDRGERVRWRPRIEVRHLPSIPPAWPQRIPDRTIEHESTRIGHRQWGIAPRYWTIGGNA